MLQDHNSWVDTLTNYDTNKHINIYLQIGKICILANYN